MTDVSTDVGTVTVRYFAAARAAAGAECETVGIGAGATVFDVINTLKVRNTALATVLQRCSYLCDGVAVRDAATAIRPGQTLDVLPPYAGG